MNEQTVGVWFLGYSVLMVVAVAAILKIGSWVRENLLGW